VHALFRNGWGVVVASAFVMVVIPSARLIRA